MKRAAARALAALVAAVAPAARAEPVALPPETAMLDALDRVCRPAGERQLSPDPFAVAAGYTPEPGPPPNLPLGATGARTWRVPTTAGRVYIISGLLPEAATQSACTAALYDVPDPALLGAVQRYLDRSHLGFVRNAGESVTTPQYRLTRYDRRVKQSVHSVFVVESLHPAPNAPTVMVSAFAVDFSWMRSHR